MSEIFMISPTPTLIVKADSPYFTIIGANNAYLEATNTRNDELIGKKLFEAFPLNPYDLSYTEGVEKLSESLNTVIRSKKPHTLDPIQYDIPIRGRSEFEVRYWHPHNIPLINDNGEVDQILHTVTDVTASSISNKKLQASESKYIELVQSMDAIIWEADPETYQYTFISSQAKKILGYDQESWYARDFWLQHVHPDDREHVLAFSQSQIKERKNHLNIYRMIAKDQSEVWISDVVSIIRDPKGGINLRGVMTDISSQKSAEKQAFENRIKIGKILENSLDIICTIDSDGLFVEMSAASESILGYKPEELTGKPFLDFVYPEDKEMTSMESKQIINGDFTSTFENRYIHKNGSIVYILWSAKWDEREQVIYCIAKDGTYKKQIEKQLLHNEQRFKSLVQYGADFTAILNEKGEFTYVSLNSESIIGYTSDYLVGQNAFRLIHKDDLVRIKELFLNLLQGKKLISDTFRYKAAHGKYQWMETIAIDMRDNPAVAGIVINSRDVTEKKHYIEWHEYVNKATNNAIYDWDILEDYIQWGGNNEIIDNDANTVNAPLKLWEERLHPEDRDIISADLKKTIENPKAFHWKKEYRFKNPKGIYLDIIEDGFFIRNAEGEAIRMIGALRDVTERKGFETELQISNKRYELVTQATSDAIWDWDITTNSLYWGNGFQKIFGHQPGNLDKDISSWNKLIHPKDYKRITDDIEHTLNSDTSTWEGEYRFLKSSGEYVYVYDRGFVQRNAEGTAIRMVGAMQNIHQEKIKEVEDDIKLSINKIFTTESSLEKSFKQTIKTILKKSEASYGEVWLTNLDQNTISLSSHYGKGTYTIDKDYLQVNLDKGLAGLLFKSRNPTLIEDIEKSDVFLRKSFAETNKFKSVWGNPIVFNEKVTAIILLYYKKQQRSAISATLSTDILNLLGIEIQRKKAELELNQFFDLSPDFLCIVDLEGKFIKVNQKFLNEIGPIQRDGHHLTYHYYTHEQDLVNVEGAIETLKNGKTAYNESRYRTKSGDYIWVGWDTVASVDQGFLFTIGKDITARKKQEKALENSNAKLSETLESIQDGFFALDFDWKVTYWNKEAEKILYSKREDVLGKSLWESFPEALKLLFYKEYNRAMKDREIVNFEEYFPPFAKWFNVSAFPSDGGITVYFKDITKIKNESTKLLTFKNVIENSKDEIAIISTVNDSIYLNPAYTESLGYGAEKLQQLGGPQQAFANEDLAAEVFSTLLSGKYWKGDVELVTKERKLHSYHISGGPIFDEEGKLIAVYMIHTDISKRREIESKLKVLYNDIKQQAKELADTQKELEQFALIASNDLQMPIIRIKENLNNLHEAYHQNTHPEVIPAISDAIQNTDKLQYMIKGLLEYTLAGNDKDAYEKVDLNEVIQNINKSLRHKIVARYALIDYPKLPTIKGNKSDFTKIFESLLDNSLTFNVERPRINIDFNATKTHWFFSIRDNGIGFDPSNANRIFQLFQTLEHHDSTSGKGIGLALCKKLVEKYGGKIWVESQPDIGSTFYFTLSKDL
ncbi:PAS domain S-box protein [Anditalea andensis]|nr:PAS domain S-box protein [Anditalea andensis]